LFEIIIKKYLTYKLGEKVKNINNDSKIKILKC